MKINLDDKLVKELDSVFDNERTTQADWDVCIEDIVEEFVARQTGSWYENNFVEEQEEPDEVYFDLRNGTQSSNGVNGKYNHTITKPPFEKNTLPNRMRGK